MSTVTLSAAHKRLFVKCWQREYAATTQLLALERRLETAELLEKPTARLSRQVATAQAKVNTACDPLIPLVQNGTLGEDATVQCQAMLGDIRGYVADCYLALWLDHKPTPST